MATTKIILQGGGGHARVVLDVLLGQGAVVPAVIDAKYSGDLLGVRRIREYDPAIEPDACGDNAVRKSVAEFTKHTFTNVIHSSAIISGYTSMGLGNMILHGAIIQAQTEIGNQEDTRRPKTRPKCAEDSSGESILYRSTRISTVVYRSDQTRKETLQR